MSTEVPPAGSRVSVTGKFVLLTLLVVGGVANAWIGLADWDADFRNTFWYIGGGSTVFLLIVWFGLWGPASRKVRVRTVSGIAALFVLAATLIRIEDFTADMGLRFAPRFSAKADELLDRLPRQASESGPESLAGLRDFPQYLGPLRNASVPGVTLETDWQTYPPEQLWKQPIGAGASGFAVVAGRAYTQEQRSQEELVVCYEVATGDVLWSHADEGRFYSKLGGDGPRATPTVDRGLVFTMGAWGLLHCFDAVTGELHWSHDVHAENDAENVEWGRSCSPLVVGELVIVSAGNKPNGENDHSLVAYDRQSGALVWHAGNDVASYASPALAELAGVPQVVMVNQNWVTSHRLVDGQILWRHPWPGLSHADGTAPQPIPLSGDRVLLAKGYGHGSELLQLTSESNATFTVTTVWRQRRNLKPKMTNLVIRDGYVYGLSAGILECARLEDAERQWKRGRYGHGQVLLVGDVLLITTEQGAVVLVEAKPKQPRVLAKLQVFEDRTWNCPALAGKYLLLRNHREAACYELPVRDVVDAEAHNSTALYPPRARK